MKTRNAKYFLKPDPNFNGVKEVIKFLLLLRQEF